MEKNNSDIFIVCGERSGDLHGSQLIKKLVKNDSELLNQVIGDTVNFDEFPKSVNVKIESIIERSPAKLTHTFFL